MATFTWTTRFNNIAPQIVLLLALAFTGQVIADEPPGGDELPLALQEAIQNPAIPMIVDATITRFTKDGAAEIKVNRIYRPAGTAGRKFKVPKTVRGYAMDGAEQRIVPLSVITDKGKHGSCSSLTETCCTPPTTTDFRFARTRKISSRSTPAAAGNHSRRSWP